ncbi:MAG TPA: hypothetical protein VK206_28430 [Anaerolineales bacterium]|nr:hypothetical protein [Anaerolineales bacterium]HLO34068.1 hypothetical protein [Anaerolineales bacterium]
MIATLLVTVMIEGVVVSGYSIWRRKPIGPILISSIFINVLTQSLLWSALSLFFQHYLATLLSAEILIWLIESVLLHISPTNRLRFNEAVSLSLAMNLASFALGWFLPV